MNYLKPFTLLPFYLKDDKLIAFELPFHYLAKHCYNLFINDYLQLDDGHVRG